MSLETQDIVIIVAAVVITLLLILCLVNICYFLWLRRDNRFPGFHNGKDGGHRSYVHRTGGFEYEMPPHNYFESTMESSNEAPTTRYHRVIQT